MLTTGSTIAGKYRLDIMIARGGMGTVWRAHHLLLDADVAVKLMDPAIATSPPGRARFAAEAKAAAKLKSRHIVQVNDYGLEEDIPYIVMELLDGEDLGARLRREGRLTTGATIEIAAQIARGLRKAHEIGIVHRDLKPANVFLARSEEEGEVAKILDFGIARFVVNPVTTDMTRTGTLLGSPPYMSPEQVRGLKSLDHRTDLWSFAVILFRMLTGELPFQSEELGDLIFRICAEPVPLVSSRVPAFPHSLDVFFQRALAKSPADRYSSVGEMMDALSASLQIQHRAPMMSIQEAPVSSHDAVSGTQTVVAIPAGRSSTPGWAEYDGWAPPISTARSSITEPLAPVHVQKTAPIGGKDTVPLGLPSVVQPGLSAPAESQMGSPGVPNTRRVRTQFGLPAVSALNPSVPAARVPAFPDPATESTAGRTIGVAPASPRTGRWKWVLGALGVVAALLALVLFRELRPSSSAEQDEPASTPVVTVAAVPSVSTAPSTSAAPQATVTTQADSPEPAPTGIAAGAGEPSASASGFQVPAARAPEAMGKLNINSIPASRVVVDGVPQGHTPRVGIPLPPGIHRVTLVSTATGVRYSTSVEVKAGQTATVAKRF